MPEGCSPRREKRRLHQETGGCELADAATDTGAGGGADCGTRISSLHFSHGMSVPAASSAALMTCLQKGQKKETITRPLGSQLNQGGPWCTRLHTADRRAQKLLCVSV